MAMNPCSGRQPTNSAVMHSQKAKATIMIRLSRLVGSFSRELVDIDLKLALPFFAFQFAAAVIDAGECREVGEHGDYAHGYN